MQKELIKLGLKKIYWRIKARFNKEEIIVNNLLPGPEFIFVHIDKTAGSSVTKHLGVKRKVHKTAKELINIVGRPAWDNSFSFCFVRNPWDRIYSNYRYRVRTNQNDLMVNTLDFNDWVKKVFVDKDPFYYNNPKFFAPCTEWITDEAGSVCVNFIGRFENLSEDWAFIANKIKADHELPHINDSKTKSYKTLYSQESIDIIASAFKSDIDMFKYTF